MTTAKYARLPGNTEWVEDYVPGGYHPVLLGDVFQSRYRILRKLGHGRSATVWLAKDETLRRYVALKVAVASESSTQKERDILAEPSLAPKPLLHNVPIPKLLDSFDVVGPNGVHSVLALEPLGQTLRDFISEVQIRPEICRERRDVGVLRELSRQIVHAVHYVHSREIVHRDIQLGNVMFMLNKSINVTNEEELEEHTRLRWSKNVFPIHRLDGKPLDKHVPSYLVKSQPLHNEKPNASHKLAPRLVLTDFGAATTFENASDGRHAYPVSSMPPEALLGLPLSAKSDIWALACTIFQMVTLGDVIYVDPFQRGEDQVNEHLQSMVEVVGPIPKRLLRCWRGRHSIVDEDGNLLKEHLQDPFSDSLHDQISDRKPPSMSSEATSTFEDFIRTMLQFEPDDRPSTKDLIQNRWLNEVD